MCKPGDVERALPDGGYLHDLAAEDLAWGKQRDALVVVVLIVPLEEFAKPDFGGADVDETPGVVGLVLRGAKVRFGEGVVVGDSRAAHTLPNAKVREEGGEGVAGHRCTTVVVYGERIGRDAVPRDGLLEELFGKRGVLVGRNHPANRVATEEVEHDVEVEKLAPGERWNLGDVPRPYLIWGSGFKTGNGEGPRLSLSTSVAHRTLLG